MGSTCWPTSKKIWRIDSNSCVDTAVVSWIDISASLNHRKNIKLMSVRLMFWKLTTLKLLMVVTFYLTKRCWLGFARLHHVTNSSSRLANTAVFNPGCSPKSCAFYSFCDYPSANCNELTVTFAHALQLHFTKGKALLCQEPTFCHILILYLSGVNRNFPWGGSFSCIWWSFVFGVLCLWRHSHVSKPTFWWSLLT